MMKATFLFTNTDGKVTRMHLVGRNAWTLSELVRAGAKGCTPITNPAPRWSAYVHRLRHDYGLDIETIHEAHSGPFPGNHV